MHPTGSQLVPIAIGATHHLFADRNWCHPPSVHHDQFRTAEIPYFADNGWHQLRIHRDRNWCGIAIGATHHLFIWITIGATHHLFIATNSALQKSPILRTMGGINCVFMGFVCETKISRSLRLASL